MNHTTNQPTFISMSRKNWRNFLGLDNFNIRLSDWTLFLHKKNESNMTNVAIKLQPFPIKVVFALALNVTNTIDFSCLFTFFFFFYKYVYLPCIDGHVRFTWAGCAHCRPFHWSIMKYPLNRAPVHAKRTSPLTGTTCVCRQRRQSAFASKCKHINKSPR